MDPVLARVREVLGPILAAHGIDLVDVVWSGGPSGRTLRVTIERLAAQIKSAPEEESGFGVSLEDCADISRDFSAALDVDDFIPGAYSLEVSSPGLDRDLRNPDDLRRFAGKRAKLKLRKPAKDGQRLLRGTLEACDDTSVAVRVDGKRLVVPFEDIAEANLVFELPSTPKAAKTGAQAKAPKGDVRATREASPVRGQKASPTQGQKPKSSSRRREAV